MVIFLAADEYHGSRWRRETRFVDAMALFLFVHHRADVDSQILVACIFSQQAAQVMVFLAKEASTQLAVGGQPDARTMSAKRLGDGRNQADLSRSAVCETVPARRFADFVPHLHERPACVNARMDF